MIRIYERLLDQSYESACRQHTPIAKIDDMDWAMGIIESLANSSYQFFAVYDYGTVTDLVGTLFGHLTNIHHVSIK